MKITLGYARNILAQYVGEGHSPEEQIVVDEINNAINWLLPKMFNNDIYCRYRFTLNNRVLTLPAECEKIEKILIDNTPYEVRSRWFEFMGYGSGGLDYGSGVSQIATYLGGGYPVFADPDSKTRLLIVSEQEETDKIMTIIGYDDNGRKIEEVIPIRHSIPAYTNNEFIKIETIIKDETDSYVLLSTFNPNTNDRKDLGYYAPSETTPSYTRYFVSSAQDNPVCIAIVRLKFIPIKKDNEVLLVQNIPVLQSMLRSLHYHRIGEIQKAVQYETLAIRLLEEDNRSKDNGIEIDFSESGLIDNKIDV